MTEMEKTLNRMKVSLKAIELAGTPARGFSPSVRTWRVTLSREIKGKEKPLKLTLTILSASMPTVDNVVECITEDIGDADMTLWDFAQAHGDKGKTSEAVERMYKTCKRTESRARKFFGDTKLVRNLLGLAA